MLVFHTIKRQSDGSCQLPITSTKHDHLIQQSLYHIMSWPYHITTCPAKKLDVLYLVAASFTWLLRASSMNRTYLRHKNHNGDYQVWCFNLHKDQPQSNSIQLKLKKQTPASHLYAKLVACLSVELVSWTRPCKFGPGRFIQQYRRIKIRHWG